MASTSGGVARGRRLVGDYIIDRQIGAGAFSTVWLARHRIQGTEVAVKEIAMSRLSEKLRRSLLSEVSILGRISHPNIIALYDFIQIPGRIYLVLELCRGGDLSLYIQSHGRVSEATAMYFMKQLASGLQVLRANNVIHRDLKPQNLLLSTYDENATLKIADFGFARSLSPSTLADTLCGTPLYMAPEVMELKKYDGKADLWSVGVIFYQLVTGKTPFTANNQIELLQNIVNAKQLCFPSHHNLSSDCMDLCQKLLHPNAVERLTFEEFFNHQFLSKQPPVDIARMIYREQESIPLVECSRTRSIGENSHDDYLPFPLDEESIRKKRNLSHSMLKGTVRPDSGFSVDIGHKNRICSPSEVVAISSGYGGHRHDSRESPGVPAKDIFFMVQKPTSSSSKDSAAVDSLELVDQDYVLVPRPPLLMSLSSVSPSRPSNSPCKSEGSQITSPNVRASSAPMPISGAAVSNAPAIRSLGSCGSPASETSHGSIDMSDAVEQPSGHFMTRIISLQQFASVITDVVKEKIENGQRLEAFSVQLVVLAIWRQALHICHAHDASGMEASPSHEVKTQKNCISKTVEYINCTSSQALDAISSEIQRNFLFGVEYGEELSWEIRQMAATKLPDAMEIIFQSALTLGRQGGVDEMMGNTESASSRYSKAVCLLCFLLVEAPSLVLSPPFSLTNSDRCRLRLYIEVINDRRGQFQLQRTVIKHEGH
ncbi:serine/threonine-protein kinase ATG1c-like isoform X4 [Musa acuminata AAA Group]|uniref:serine/threonine-protein kinase ATG1c-like isoform X4 n=1 Tax=Musa acuminata AAA Group TaxID=214697 RepID=UPI0031D4BF9C